MAFDRAKRAETLLIAASCLVLCITGPSPVHAEDSTKEPETHEALNTIGINAALGLSFEDGPKVGGGGNVSYERELIPKDLQMELVVGFGTIDKSFKVPIGLLFTHAWVPNEVWEPDVGLGGTVTIERERNASGGMDTTTRFGITFAGGTHIWLWGSHRRWGLGLTVVYTLQVTRGVSHELFLAFGPSVRF